MVTLKVQDLKEVVTCSKNNHILVDPHRLQCCHSYCKACLPTTACLPTNTSVQPAYPPTTYQCTQCQAVTPTDLIMQSFFMQQLVKMYHASLQEPKCVMCAKINPKFKCNRCQEFYCEICAPQLTKIACTTHLHKLTEYRSESDDVVLDIFLSCEVHRGQELKIHCQKCDKLICSECRFQDHEHHKVVTLESALKDVDNLNGKLQNETGELIAKYKKFIDSVKETEACFNDHVKTSLEELTRYRDEIITSINRQYEECQQKIKQKQVIVTGELTQLKNTELVKSARIENVKNWCSLVQGTALQQCKMKIYLEELKQLYQSLSRERAKICPATINDIQLTKQRFVRGMGNASEWHLGEVCDQQLKLFSLTNPLSDSALQDRVFFIPTRAKERITDCIFVRNIDLPSGTDAWSLLVYNNVILVPKWNSNTVDVLSSETGKLTKTATLPKNIKCCSIQRLTETQVVLSATDGLYMLDTNTLEVKEKLYEGKFGRGLYVNNGEVTALKVGSKEVVELICSPGSRIVQYNIITKKERVFNDKDSVVKYKDRLYVGYWGKEKGKVCAYNIVTGAVLHQFYMQYPILLSVDKQGALICCQCWGSKCISASYPVGESYQVVSIRFTQCEGCITAADITGSHLYIRLNKTVLGVPTEKSSLSILSIR